jgi:hypothetical protein
MRKPIYTNVFGVRLETSDAKLLIKLARKHHLRTSEMIRRIVEEKVRPQEGK